MSRNWMDCHSEWVTVGEIAFCSEIFDGVDTGLFVSPVPYRKNMSGEKILRGWCGITNNMNVWARGAGVVRRIKPSKLLDDNGDPLLRCQVERLSDTDAGVITLCEKTGVI